MDWDMTNLSAAIKSNNISLVNGILERNRRRDTVREILFMSPENLGEIAIKAGNLEILKLLAAESPNFLGMGYVDNEMKRYRTFLSLVTTGPYKNPEIEAYLRSNGVTD